jgi:hypothetical protein
METIVLMHGNKSDVHANTCDFIGLGGLGKICLRVSQNIKVQILIGVVTLANEIPSGARNLQSELKL